VIPIEESLIYVRPLYLRSEGGNIPELKRVIVVYEKQIAMEPSLQEAMDAIFGAPQGEREMAQAEPASAGDRDDSDTPTAEPDARTSEAGRALEVQALEHFERAIAAQRAGDWAAYGRELDNVQRLLRSLQPAQPPPRPQQPTAEPPPPR
jgi:uncharacterized membrane protein (UPF0182 family)